MLSQARFFIWGEGAFYPFLNFSTMAPELLARDTAMLPQGRVLYLGQREFCHTLDFRITAPEVLIFLLISAWHKENRSKYWQKERGCPGMERKNLSDSTLKER